MSLFYQLAKQFANKAGALPPRLAGKIDRSVAFIHMPKCGGTSVHTAISRHYRADQVIYLDPTASRKVSQADEVNMLPFRRSLLAYELARKGKNRFISGHWPLDQDLIVANKDQWSFVTILRDPVERWISNYFFNRDRPSNRDHFGTELDLEAYLETKDAIENGKLYLSFCHGGAMPDGDLTATIAQAIKVFDNFELIGNLDDMETFLDGFQNRWKVRPTIPVSNINPTSKTDRRNALTPSIMERIELICAPDRQIYEAVCSARKST